MNDNGSKPRATYLAQAEISGSFPRARTVLLVIDPVNDFLSEGGAAYELTKTTLKLHNVIENMKRAIEGARRVGLPVLFGPMAYTCEDYADGALQRRSGINRIMFERRMFLAGSWGADFHPDLRPREDEIVLLPHKGTDVYETDLPEHLRRLGTTHVVIIGMTANLCCEGTGRHLAEAGYDVTFLSDAIGSESLPSYEAAVVLNYPLIGNGVIKVDDFLTAIIGAEQAPLQVQVGDLVRGSDHLEIGEVAAVEAATDDTEGYLQVPRGLLLEKTTYIPLDAITRRIGREVFINVPRLVVGKMPWGEPPARQVQRAKWGPQHSEVERLYGSRAPSATSATSD